MKVLLTGASGQLGRALQASKPLDIDLIPITRQELDMSDYSSCLKLAKEIKPDWILNAGAYTAVDKAEIEKDLAFAVNAKAPKAFVEALDPFGGRLLQLSTDFVFNGQQDCPYKVDDPIDPLSIYGASKAAGEKEAMKLPGSRVLRTSWVYGPIGNNFCLTMLGLHRLKGKNNEPLRVVSDQIGCPTSTQTLAHACWKILLFQGKCNLIDIFHWSDAGQVSWYDFAIAIGELGVQLGLLEKSALVQPITTSEFPTLAKRPRNSLLDCQSTIDLLMLDQQVWKVSLNDVLRKILNFKDRYN